MSASPRSEHKQPDVEALLEQYGTAFLAQARRFSATAADADDAFQRAVEVLLTKRPPEIETLPTLAAWMKTVVRNEALQIHRRGAFERPTDFASDESLLGTTTALDDRIVESTELDGQREALARINPGQARCLLLRADGHAYPEICEITGFSHSKVNRLISEGRRALTARVAMIDAGVECRRVEPLLSQVADGEAQAATLAEIGPHLKHCLSCRATLRDYRLAPRDLAATFPLGLLGSVGPRGWIRRLGDAFDSTYVWVQERVFGHPALHQGPELATAKKIAAVAAISGTLVVGGAGVKQATDDARTDSTTSAGSGATQPRPSGTAKSVTTGAHERSASRRGQRARREPRDSDLAGPRAGQQIDDAATPEPVGSSAPATTGFTEPVDDTRTTQSTSDNATDLAP